MFVVLERRFGLAVGLIVVARVTSAVASVDACPTNDEVFLPNENAVVVPVSQQCPKFYSEIFSTTGCADESGGACTYCNNGTALNWAGACATVCPIKTSLVLTGGVTVPLWKTPATAHGLHIAFGDGADDVCHIDMTTDAATRTLHVKDATGTVYSAQAPAESVEYRVCMPTYSVVYNCGTGASGIAPDAQSIILTYPFSFSGVGGCARSGYSPTGWEMNGTNYAIDAKTFVWNTTAGATATLQWAANTYKASYICESGNSAAKTDSVTYDTSYTINYTGCTKVGHDFGGWSSDATYQNGDSFVWQTAGDKTFTGIWNVKQLTATYNCDGGTGTTPASANVTWDTDYTLAANTCAKDGYWYRGWTNSGTRYQPGDTYHWTPETNQTFTADWLAKYNAGVAGTAYTGDDGSNTWTATFPYATVSGTAMCSSDNGEFADFHQAAAPASGGKWCWCKMTIAETRLASDWVSLFGYSESGTEDENGNYTPGDENETANAALCAENCALHCGYTVANYDALRTTIFDSVSYRE